MPSHYSYCYQYEFPIDIVTDVNSIVDDNVCVCVRSKANPLHYYALRVPPKGGYMALSVVYFRITHRLGRPHYVWDEYLL